MALPTEDEARHRRETIRRRYPQLFKAVEEQLRYVDDELPSIGHGHRNLYDYALTAHLARASSTALGIVLLCENCFGELAVTALRPLGETMVSAYYMSLDPDKRAAVFREFANFEAVDTYKLFTKIGWDVAEALPKFRDDEWVGSVRKQFPKPSGWMQVGMDKVVESIECCWRTEKGRQQLLEVANLIKLIGDRHSHVGSIDTVTKLSTGTEGQLNVNLGPSGKEWVPMVLTLSAWVYGQIFDLWAEHFELPDLDSWRGRWQLLLARCQTVSRDVARGTGRNDPCPCGSGFKFKRCHLEIVE